MERSTARIFHGQEQEWGDLVFFFFFFFCRLFEHGSRRGDRSFKNCHGTSRVLKGLYGVFGFGV